MIRVAQIIDSLHFGGAQKWQVMFAQSVPKQDVALTVISLKKNSQGTDIPDELQSLGVRVVYFLPKIAMGLLDFPRLWRLAQFLRREQFDVVHTHLTYANIIGVMAAKLAGIPVVATIQNSRYDGPHYHPLRYRLETWTLRCLADRLMAVGHVTAKSNEQRLRGKLIEPVPTALEIMPPLSEAECNALRAEIIGDPARPWFISVGRLTQQKGYSDLITAFADVHQIHPSAVLVIVGGGALHNELKTQIESLGVEGHAVLLGRRNDVPRLLAASDIFVSSSHWEGLPVAVLEAMASGLPVVATSVSDVPRVVIKGTGIVVPPQKPVLLAQALCSLLNDPALLKAYGKAAQDHISRHHNPAGWVNKIFSIYNSLQKNQVTYVNRAASY